MNKYVISLQVESKRRAHIQSEFSKQDIPFKFFDAITPEIAEKNASRLGIIPDERYLTRGELACFMSHVALWQKMIKENLPYIAIFEDDVFLGKNAENLLNATDWIPKTLEIIKLEAFNPNVVLGSKISSINNRELFYLKGTNLGAAGYIISLHGAKSLIHFIQNYPILLPLDHMVFEIYLRKRRQVVSQLVPALCIQELEMNKVKNSGYRLKSALLDERHSRMKNHKVKGFLKVKKEAARLPLQLYNFIFSQKVWFE